MIINLFDNLKKSVFVDSEIASSTYIPSYLLSQDNEMASVSTIFCPTLMESHPPNIIIYGIPHISHLTHPIYGGYLTTLCAKWKNEN